jgi:hypothetical protein
MIAWLRRKEYDPRKSVAADADKKNVLKHQYVFTLITICKILNQYRIMNLIHEESDKKGISIAQLALQIDAENLLMSTSEE